MALLRDFFVGRHDLNPKNSRLFLRFKSGARLELTQNPSFVDGHGLRVVVVSVIRFIRITGIMKK